ncbi:centrosomal protein of 192 kDa isoform X1 [Anguilla anguilla]|uniref:centrosomal protein of 192 kDa isoform X1 n=1 Tax=Anguilla anguilla TaxID=7936 RepID=UPI0015B15442|nr:centrosomal protein of 192 kDa isoform X1 [Anguilla anguilla]XP_035234831.1 centrosomal protein of 192 kDa isoform X1 [Anguilla anguilla]
MTESFHNIEDEPFPSFLSASLGSGNGTLGNVTLGSRLGVPVAASTVAKIRAGADNRISDIQASYLEDGQLSLVNSQPSSGQRGKFALSFKDDLDGADDFIAAHRLSDMLVKIHLDEGESTARLKAPPQGSPLQADPPAQRASEHGDDLSTGLITFSHLGARDVTDMKGKHALPEVQEEGSASDSDRLSGSVSSFVANEKLLSVYSLNSDATDDDIDVDQLQDDELELYFNKLVPPAMQRGRVEGQEIPPTGQTGIAENSSHPGSAEPEKNRYNFLDDFDQDDFQMPDVRLAATGMDSCPASDEEDTEDELEAARRLGSARPRFLLPSTSRQLVGESHRPNFRPGLEGGSSDDEPLPAAARNAPANSGIEFRRSAEGQVINPPITGDGGGGGDGSSGSEEDGNDGGVSTIPLPPGGGQAYDGPRGSGAGGDQDGHGVPSLPAPSRASVPGHSEMGDRVGPVGTGEGGFVAPGLGPPRLSPVNWSMTLDRQEALDAMDSAESAAAADGPLDSLYLWNGGGLWRPPDALGSALLQGTLQSSFHLSQAFPSHSASAGQEEEEGALGLRGGPCGYSTVPEPSDSSGEGEPRAASLEAKYLSQTGRGEEGDDIWDRPPDSAKLDFQQGGNVAHSVVYQNEEGKWVTDLAYYSSFEKEAEVNFPKEVASEFQSEEFVSGMVCLFTGNAIEKIIEDQEEFEKENQFIQEEQMAAESPGLGLGDTSWRLPSSNHILMRASQVSSDFERGNQSYLRLSLGEFFLQRSEALGCLGDSMEDRVKRPSFGYVITSPEKREPFALIRPSDFSSRGSSVHSDTLLNSDADDTMNREELNKTAERSSERTEHREDEKPAAPEKEEAKDPRALAPEPQSVPAGSGDSPNSSNDLLLSISTIATAIADASLSSDPAQLAAMIMELSKKNRDKGRRPAAADRSALLEALQRSAASSGAAGAVPSALDMEKYLRRAETSGSDSDCSASRHSFDILGWADGSSAASTLRASHAATAAAAAPPAGKEDPEARRKERKSSAAAPPSNARPGGGAGRKPEARRSSIPRPKASCGPAASANGSRRSVGAGQAPHSAHSAPASKPAPAQSRPEQGAPGPAVSNRGGSQAPPASGGVAPSPTPVPVPTPRSVVPDEPASVPRTSPRPRDLPSGPPPRSPVPNPFWQGNDGREGAGPSTANREPPGHSAVEKHVGFTPYSHLPSAQSKAVEGAGSPSERPRAAVEESHCAFRPSTSPLTHSSPSQTSFPSADGTVSSPGSPGGPADRRGCETLSPQSHCSSPSLSRLTYISLNDSTVLPSPDRGKVSAAGNSSIALSTTIVRSSPTPLTEQELPQSRPNAPLGQPLGLDPRPSRGQSPDGRPEARSPGSRYASDPDPRDGPPQRRPEPVPRRPAPGDSGYSGNLNFLQPGPSSEPGPPSLWAGAPPDKREPRQVAGFGLPPSYPAEDLRYVPGFKPQGGPLLEPPPTVPSLLAGRPLYSGPLAQQYLGGDVPLHPYAVAPGYAHGVCPALPHANPPSGLALQHGYVAASQLHRAHLPPLEPGLLGPGKPYGPLGALGVWSTAGLADLSAQVVVPDELRFPGSCCVGIASQTSLSIFNPTERWLQVGIAVSGLAIDGEKVDSLPYQWLMVKNKTIIGPKSTEEQKVLLVPPRAGVYQCTLSVSSWPTAAEAEAAARAQVFAKRVVLVAMAENPSLEVDAGAAGCLDFGDLAGGSARALPLKLVNRTRATVPVRLVISANATAWRCFTFSKSPVAVPTEAMLQTGSVAPLAAPSVMNHVMHANYGDNPESFMLWVHFHAPQKYASASGALGPADEYSARVDIEVDSPGPSQVIRSVQLRARSGTARVHAPKDMQVVQLVTMLGKSTSQTLPLKNAGNIDVQLKLRSSGADDCFSVTPEELLLRAGEERGVTVSFAATGARKCRESMLTILVLPSGPQYEVVLKGEVAPDESPRRPLPGRAAHADAPPPGEVPPILSNKQFMAWGGVTLGRAVQQKLVLRNNSPSSTQQLRLLIRGQDQDCFQLQSTFGPEERLTRHRELSIRPKEDVAVHLLFAPTRVACMLAKLEIKQSAVRPSQPGVKFTIPLSGYGGTSNIILEEVKKLSDSYVVTLGGVAAGRVSKACLSMRNTGSRAAFVRAAAFSDVQARAVADPALISLAPAQFVLKERTQEVITVTVKATPREQELCQSGAAPLATVCFFCGDEVSRQQYKRFVHSNPDAGRKVLSDNSLLKNVNFHRSFLGEEQVTEAYDLPLRPNEAHLFYGGMSKVVLSVLGSAEGSDSGESDGMETLRPSARRGSESDSGFGNSDRHVSNVSLDVLPVRGPQGPPLALNVAAPALKGQSDPAGPQGDSWSVRPEQLVLTAPTLSSTTDTRHVQIQNHSSRALNFELSWPAHCLTITPQHGVIEPESDLQILISPNPSLATKLSLLPWSGQIYVQCDGQQKFIKVQIRQDLALDVSATASLAKPLSSLPPQAETPPAPGCRTPGEASAQVEIKNRTLVFPATASGETSESVLEVENKGEEVRWYLSSFAPPYVKGVDSSGDVYRATYTAFRCSRVSGTLGVQEKMQIPITFLPRDRGDYAQFWDLECHPLAEPQHKSRIRFQLCGTGVKAGAPVPPQERNCSLVRTEATAKARKRPEAPPVKTSQEEAPRRGVYAPQDLYTFPQVRAGESSTLKVNVRNNSFDTHELKFVSPREPFFIKHSKYSLRSQHYINIPVQFKPGAAGKFSSSLLIQADTSASLSIRLTGEALP